MKRKLLVRFELLLLAIATVLLAYRVMEGPPAPSGLIVLHDIERNEVYRKSFAVSGPARVAIDAVGSYESDEPESALAAYGWLLRREDRQIVWRMDPERTGRAEGTLASVRDTVELVAGTYDAFFASIGNSRDGGFNFLFLDRLFGGKANWHDDAKNWRFVVTSVEGSEVQVRAVEPAADAELAPAGADLIWTSAPMSGGNHDEFVFVTTERSPVWVYAVGEIDDRPMDYGWIEDAMSRQRIWEMKRENTKPAGGWHVNRLFSDTLHLDPGVYRAVFVTDPRQDFKDWVANPPFDPAGWGLSLFSPNMDAVKEFDPWTSRKPILQIMEVGDDERHIAQLQVTTPVQVAVSAMGEMSSGGRYDYAWISSNDRQEMVWEMDYKDTSPAGGHNNRIALAFLELPEGTYTVTYETDDSHSFSSWRHGRPNHPERWGVSIFPVQEEIDTSAVRVISYSVEGLADHPSSEEPEDAEKPALRDLAPLPGMEIVDLTALGNEQTVSQQFELEEAGAIHIRALGEVSMSGRYDYGWIERAENGEIVWEMNWQNTRPAGGDDVNRIFDGAVELEPGTYIVRFRTDFSHAFGDFDGRAPHTPQAWGIRISR